MGSPEAQPVEHGAVPVADRVVRHAATRTAVAALLWRRRHAGGASALVHAPPKNWVLRGGKGAQRSRGRGSCGEHGKRSAAERQQQASHAG